MTNHHTTATYEAWSNAYHDKAHPDHRFMAWLMWPEAVAGAEEDYQGQPVDVRCWPVEKLASLRDAAGEAGDLAMVALIDELTA